MGVKGQNAISCRGGLGVHVTRGEHRILEMESHLKCMREKLTMLETMLPSSATYIENQEVEPETDGQKDCSNMDEKKVDEEEQMCVLRSLAIKEKKLRDEIFNMECKEKVYLNALLKVNIEESNRKEIKKPEDNHDLFQTDNSPKSRKRESDEKEKISQLDECSKKLCDCLRNIQINRKEWSQEIEYLSKELNQFEDDPGLEEHIGFLKPGRYQEKGNECPCGEAAKCNSCTICNCSDWEQDLEIGGKEKESKSPRQEKEKELKKKKNCNCFTSDMDSDQYSKSMEINDIYNCSIWKMQSEISIATTSIPSTVENVITGDEEDKTQFCCLCNPEDECQKFCEICLCEWDREYQKNQQLYSDDYDICDLCESCKEERFRGGTDSGIPINEKLCTKDVKELPSTVKQLLSEPGKKLKGENSVESKKVLSSIDDSQLSTNLQNEELRFNVQNLRNTNNVLRKWLKDQNYQENFNPSKDKIIATLIDEIKQNPIQNRSKTWKKRQKEKTSQEEMPTKNLAIGLFVLLLTLSSHFLGSSGIFSLSLVFKFFFQILSFPFQTCVQIQRYFLILFNTLREWIFNYSEVLLNTLQNKNIENLNIDSLSIIIQFFAFFGFFFFFFILEALRKVLFSTENVSHDGKLSDAQLGVNVESLSKKTMMFFLRPLVFVLNFIKCGIFFILTFSSKLINFCVPKCFKNFLYRAMGSFIDIFRLLFKGKPRLWCVSNFIYITFGFLANKIWNSEEIEFNLCFFQIFNNSLREISEIDRNKNFTNVSRNEWCKNLFSIIFENICECAKILFHSFDIKW